MSKKIILRESSDDYSLLYIVYLFTAVMLVGNAFYNKGLSEGPIIVFIAISLLCFWFYSRSLKGSYMEITNEHIAMHAIFRFGADKILWIEKFADNRQVIMQESLIRTGDNKHRKGIRILVYKKGYETHTRTGFIEYRKQDKEDLLKMIKEYNLPLLLTKE